MVCLSNSTVVSFSVAYPRGGNGSRSHTIGARRSCRSWLYLWPCSGRPYMRALPGNEVGCEGVQVRVGRGPLPDVVEVVEPAGRLALGAETETGGLELGDRVQNMLEAGLSAVGRSRRGFLAVFLHEEAVVSELAERLASERSVDTFDAH